MINYDEFKKHESVIGKLPLIPLELTSRISQNVGETVEYRGLKLKWTGFMAVPDSEKILCRWQCYFKFAKDNNTIVGLLSMNTGNVAFFRQGETFDITVKLGFGKYCFLEELLQWPEFIQEAKQITLDNLKKAIDENWDIIQADLNK